MKHLFIFIVLIATSIVSLCQSNQTLRFTVNSYSYIYEDETKEEGFKPICDPFSVIITNKTINIGEDFDLKIVNKKYYPDKGYTLYEVEDMAAKEKICTIFLKMNEKGNYSIQVHSCNEDGSIKYNGAIILSQFVHISLFDLWRYVRSKK